MKATTRIEKRVLQWAKRCLGGDSQDNIKTALQDVTQHGCESGIVEELIYCHDTIKWFKYYRKDINTMLQDVLFNFGGNISDLFGHKWDESDPLAQDTTNQNLLAWFSFEQSANNLLMQLEDQE